MATVPRPKPKGEPKVTETPVETAPVVEQDAQPVQNENVPKPAPEPAFPQGTVVTFVKTDYKGQFGVVTGLEATARGAYTGVQLTHYASGKPRPADKVPVITVRAESIAEGTVPEYVEPVKPEPKAEEPVAETAPTA